MNEKPECFGKYHHYSPQDRAERDCPNCLQILNCPLAQPSAPDFLRRAADIMTERGKQYDKPEGERSMGKCVAAFNIVTGHNLTEAEGWLLLQILKDVRQWQRPGFHEDSADDCIAYAALKAEAKQREVACNGR